MTTNVMVSFPDESLDAVDALARATPGTGEDSAADVRARRDRRK